jgi:hypothetical protein
MQSDVVIEFKSDFHSIEPTVIFAEHILSTSTFSLEGPLLNVASVYLFRVFVEVTKSTDELDMPVHLSVSMYHLGSHWMDLLKI